MPELGESVTEGTVTRWLKQVGDTVEVDEPLLEVSTDKVDTEIPSPVAGTLLEITADEDETVEVGAQLAVVGDASRRRPAAGAAPEGPEQRAERSREGADRRRPEPTSARTRHPTTRSPRPSSPPPTGRATASRRPSRRRPSAQDRDQPKRPSERAGRTRARGRGEPAAPRTSPRSCASSPPSTTSTCRRSPAPASAAGSASRTSWPPPRRRRREPEPEPEPERGRPGARGARPHAPARRRRRTPARRARPQPGSTVKMPRLRQVIAQRMTESLRVSAQLTTVQEVDVTRIARLRARAKAEFERREGVKLTFLPFFAKAAVEALKAYPQVNASIDRGRQGGRPTTAPCTWPSPSTPRAGCSSR